ncbi:MAG: hypothetical protein OXF26_01645, partial [Alphaproteobacteria bacterium]|nr:hypothetical protein [Alphaproteobacteria bacterium]
DDAYTNRVTAELVEQWLLDEVRRTKSLTQGAAAADVRVHTLPARPRDIEDDGDFHFAVLGPGAVSDSGKPSPEARRFIDETTGPDRPRVRRNALVLVAPSRDGLEAARARIREYLGWEEVRSELGNLASDPAREGKLASSIEQARKRIPDAVRQAWSIVIAVNERNDIQAFKATVGAEALFATVKADRRARIQETAISAEAMLPGGPYDLWRDDEPSRRVKDLVGAFAENPRLPKMLRHKEILDTIDQGVRAGIFVASLVRPDKSVRTWWRTTIDDAAREDSALELCLPEKAVLSYLDPNVLVPSALPELWDGEVITVADIIAYFASGRTVTVQRESYAEPFAIPACSRAAVETAVSEAVHQGVLWLVNGPASFQREAVPPGVLTEAAELRAPLSPLSLDQLTEDAVPEAWTDGQTNALAVSAALAVKLGHQLPWSVFRRALDDAFASRWLERTPDSGPWPCDAVGAAAVTLIAPKRESVIKEDGEGIEGGPPGALIGSADLDPHELQDLVEVLPDVVAKAAGVSLKFYLRITLGDGADVPTEVRSSLNELLEGVNADLRLKQ